MTNASTYHTEEKLNAWSHGLGILLGFVGFIYLWNNHNPLVKWASASILIYSFSVILLFTASTMYHSVQAHGLKKKLRVLDHISIYFLIAGTYTPVALITLRESKGIPLFFIVWGVALAGTLFKIFYTGKLEWLSLMLYLVMGWLIVFDFLYLWEQLSVQGITFLFLGGAFYTLGTFFYAVRKIPYNHFIWHIFVLGGAVSHWFLIHSSVI